MKRVLLVGDDSRLLYLGKELSRHPYKVYWYKNPQTIPDGFKIQATDSEVEAEIIILPIPSSKLIGQNIPLEDILATQSSAPLVIGGYFSESMRSTLQRFAHRVIDVGLDPDFAQQNATPTAEGAIGVAICNSPFVLENQKICVVGYGRIGKILTKKLIALGCDVTATARKQAHLKEIADIGAKPYYTQELNNAEEFSLIFNTVPSLVIDSAVLSRQSSGTYIIDLASLPGGVDREVAQQRGISVIQALSLPARLSPLTAGKILFHIIAKHISEVNE